MNQKGGYARDLIEVIVNDDQGKSKIVQALLYRGTPDSKFVI